MDGHQQQLVRKNVHFSGPSLHARKAHLAKLLVEESVEGVHLNKKCKFIKKIFFSYFGQILVLLIPFNDEVEEKVDD